MAGKLGHNLNTYFNKMVLQRPIFPFGSFWEDIGQDDMFRGLFQAEIMLPAGDETQLTSVADEPCSDQHNCDREDYFDP